jgi:hypothetical protein
MTHAFACDHCGSLDAPWSRGHAPTCPAGTPLPRARVCTRCRHLARVADVRRVPRVEVDFQCRGCGHRWTETTDPDTEPPDPATRDIDTTDIDTTQRGAHNDENE